MELTFTIIALSVALITVWIMFQQLRNQMKEETRSEFRILSESIKGIKEDIKDLKEDNKDLRNDLSKLNDKIDKVNADLSARMDAMNARMDTVISAIFRKDIA
jgi:uncharacterized protein YoxC